MLFGGDLVKKLGLVVLFTMILAGFVFGQGLLETEKIAGVKSKKIVLGEESRYSNLIWDNGGIWAWWSGVDTGYINLDWADLHPSPTGLQDEVIDGFTFSYGTNNNMGWYVTFEESFAVYYFDKCTGWGNKGVLEAAFLFTGLPGGVWTGGPPGYGWVWTITIDLEDSGYEFVLGPEFGQGLSRWSIPTMGHTGLAIAGGGYGSENAFDIYYPNGVYNGTWWFGSALWASWGQSLYGPQAPGTNLTYYGRGAQGNDTGLYAIGDWSSQVHFML